MPEIESDAPGDRPHRPDEVSDWRPAGPASVPDDEQSALEPDPDRRVTAE